MYIIGGDLGENVLMYNTKTNKCDRLQAITLSSRDINYEHDMIVTPDQRYIIILNTFEKDVYDEDYNDEAFDFDTEIQILDLENMSCTTSPVRLPGTWEYEPIHAVLVDDYQKHDIINGYLRTSWEDEAFKGIQR